MVKICCSVSVCFHKTTLGISRVVEYIYCASRQSIVLGEPSVVATDIYNEKVVAIGDKAKNDRKSARNDKRRSPYKRRHYLPILTKTVAMLCQYVSRVVQTRIGITSAIVVPAAASSVERRSMRDMAKAAYGSRVVPVDEPIAAALGCRLDVFQRTRPHYRGHRRRQNGYKRCCQRRRYACALTFRMQRHV